jgi:hypothetical protein
MPLTMATTRHEPLPRLQLQDVDGLDLEDVADLEDVVDLEDAASDSGASTASSGGDDLHRKRRSDGLASKLEQQAARDALHEQLDHHLTSCVGWTALQLWRLTHSSSCCCAETSARSSTRASRSSVQACSGSPSRSRSAASWCVCPLARPPPWLVLMLTAARARDARERGGRQRVRDAAHRAVQVPAKARGASRQDVRGYRPVRHGRCRRRARQLGHRDLADGLLYRLYVSWRRPCRGTEVRADPGCIDRQT